MENRDLLSALKRYFGFESFREGQEAIISAVMGGQDCVAILPTGGGKSLCFQLPALIRPGLTLVVSPLISLMKNQVDSLRANQIRATYINSSLAWPDMRDRLDKMAQGHYQLVYIAPERFRSDQFLGALSQVSVNLFAIDEAHCISMWGHDFRPDYLCLEKTLVRLKSPQVMALTATATPEVREDIVRQLGLSQPPRGEAAVIVSGFARPSLTLAVSRCATHAAKLDRALTILDDFPTGIIYCATRGNVEKVTAKLCQRGIRCISYHAGIPDGERKRVQDLFLGGETPVAVATNAFGMGIDRADLRFIIHWDVPGSIEAYYQEAGRAGRDGKPAHCEILFNYADVRTQEFFIEGANPSPDLVNKAARAVQSLAKMSEGPVPVDGPFQSRLGQEVNPMALSTALGILDRAGFLSRTSDGRAGKVQVTLVNPRADLSKALLLLNGKAERDRDRLRLLLRYVNSRSCRHEAILQHFGDPASVGECRRCDNCLARSGQGKKGRRPPDEEEWVEVQKVLSCVVRLRGRYGRARVAQVLMGSRDQAVLGAKLHLIPTHGAMAGYPQDYIRELMEALIDEECIQVTGDEYPTLEITPRGKAVMLRQGAVELQWPERRLPGRAKREASGTKETTASTRAEVRPELVDRLRALRARLAQERNVPAYQILHNATIDEIAAACPKDRTELLAVKGIGPAKLVDLGEEILGALRQGEDEEPA